MSDNFLPISDKTLRSMQAISGIAFSSFLTVHLANQYTAILGHLWYDEVMTLLRKVYQNKYVEPALIFGSLGIHAASSGILIIRRNSRLAALQEGKRNSIDREKEPEYPTPVPAKAFAPPLHLFLHRVTGYVLSTFIGGHIFATRAPAWIFGHKPADFALVTFSIEQWPYIFYPYYILFSTSAAYHLTYGWFQALRTLLPSSYTSSSSSPFIKGLFKVEKGLGFNLLMGGFLAAGVMTVAAFGERLFPLENKERYPEFKEFYEWAAPSFMQVWRH